MIEHQLDIDAVRRRVTAFLARVQAHDAVLRLAAG